MSRRVGLVTYAALPSLSPDDQLVAAALARRGVRADAVVWTDPGVAWEEFDAVLLRSCWDYHHRLGEFLAWVDRLEGAGTALWNPPAVVRWNTHKGYLADLEARGVRVVPTAWASADEPRPLAALVAERGWRGGVVVKPVVSASAHDTWRIDGVPTAADEARFVAVRARAGGAMVQPFVAEVAEAGEWSVVVIAGAASHAVLKRPADGDFRVQHEHGGSAEAAAPPPALLADARAALDAAAGAAGVGSDALLYARVDGVARDGRLVVMEVECIEPSLFFALAPAGAERLAAAMAARLGATAEPASDAAGRSGVVR